MTSITKTYTNLPSIISTVDPNLILDSNGGLSEDQKEIIMAVFYAQQKQLEILIAKNPSLTSVRFTATVQHSAIKALKHDVQYSSIQAQNFNLAYLACTIGHANILKLILNRASCLRDDIVTSVNYKTITNGFPELPSLDIKPIKFNPLQFVCHFIDDSISSKLVQTLCQSIDPNQRPYSDSELELNPITLAAKSGNTGALITYLERFTTHEANALQQQLIEDYAFPVPLAQIIREYAPAPVTPTTQAIVSHQQSNKNALQLVMEKWIIAFPTIERINAIRVLMEHGAIDQDRSCFENKWTPFPYLRRKIYYPTGWFTRLKSTTVGSKELMKEVGMQRMSR